MLLPPIPKVGYVTYRCQNQQLAQYVVY